MTKIQFLFESTKQYILNLLQTYLHGPINCPIFAEAYNQYNLELTPQAFNPPRWGFRVICMRTHIRLHFCVHSINLKHQQWTD